MSTRPLPDPQPMFPIVPAMPLIPGGVQNNDPPQPVAPVYNVPGEYLPRYLPSVGPTQPVPAQPVPAQPVPMNIDPLQVIPRQLAELLEQSNNNKRQRDEALEMVSQVEEKAKKAKSAVKAPRKPPPSKDELLASIRQLEQEVKSIEAERLPDAPPGLLELRKKIELANKQTALSKLEEKARKEEEKAKNDALKEEQRKAKEAEKAKNDALKEEQRKAKEAEKAEKEALKAAEKEAKEADKTEKEALKAAEKEAKEALKKAREEEKAEKEALKEAEKEAKEEEKAKKEAEKEAEKKQKEKESDDLIREFSEGLDEPLTADDIRAARTQATVQSSREGREVTVRETLVKALEKKRQVAARKRETENIIKEFSSDGEEITANDVRAARTQAAIKSKEEGREVTVREILSNKASIEALRVAEIKRKEQLGLDTVNTLNETFEGFAKQKEIANIVKEALDDGEISMDRIYKISDDAGFDPEMVDLRYDEMNGIFKFAQKQGALKNGFDAFYKALAILKKADGVYTLVRAVATRLDAEPRRRAKAQEDRVKKLCESVKKSIWREWWKAETLLFDLIDRMHDLVGTGELGQLFEDPKVEEEFEALVANSERAREYFESKNRVYPLALLEMEPPKERDETKCESLRSTEKIQDLLDDIKRLMEFQKDANQHMKKLTDADFLDYYDFVLKSQWKGDADVVKAREAALRGNFSPPEGKADRKDDSDDEGEDDDDFVPGAEDADDAVRKYEFMDDDDDEYDDDSSEGINFGAVAMATSVLFKKKDVKLEENKKKAVEPVADEDAEMAEEEDVIDLKTWGEEDDEGSGEEDDEESGEEDDDESSEESGEEGEIHEEDESEAGDDDAVDLEVEYDTWKELSFEQRDLEYNGLVNELNNVTKRKATTPEEKQAKNEEKEELEDKVERYEEYEAIEDYALWSSMSNEQRREEMDKRAPKASLTQEYEGIEESAFSRSTSKEQRNKQMEKRTPKAGLKKAVTPADKKRAFRWTTFFYKTPKFKQVVDVDEKLEDARQRNADLDEQIDKELADRHGEEAMAADKDESVDRKRKKNQGNVEEDSRVTDFLKQLNATKAADKEAAKKQRTKALAGRGMSMVDRIIALHLSK